MITAIVPWGDQIEDFLDEIGVSLEEFSAAMTGGWLFGYIDALRRCGIESVVFCFSDRITTTVRTVHQPTGARMVILRVPSAYRRLRRRMADPYGCSMQAMFGNRNGGPQQYWRAAYHAAPYLATPITRFAREIRRAGCTTILCQEYESPRFDALVAIGAALRIPVFATFQGGNWHRSGLERRVRRHSLRRSAGVIIGSSTEAERVGRVYGIDGDRVARIFNPIDLSKWQPLPRAEARRALRIPDATRVAIWHGRVDVRNKGLDLLLKAWRIVRSARSDRNDLLVLVGSGAGDDALDAGIRALGTESVLWRRGYLLEKAAIRQPLSAAAVYVFPSRHEGFPVAPLEAMACGLPVIASSVPGVAEILGADHAFGGTVVPAGDYEALAHGLIELLDSEALSRTRGVRARARVEQAFSPEIIGTQLSEFLTTRH
jgi:glycosyltransferase involved in cell wall biosynthesis